MFLLNSSIICIPIITLIIVIAIQQKHFLMVLLTFEAITLLTTSYVSISSSMLSNNTPFLIMFILTMGATEASLGLSILILMTRQTGSDKISSLSSVKC